MNLIQLPDRIALSEPIEFPQIEPISEGIHRPFWSVMIPTYNRTKLLVEALESVLAQDLGPDEMQIEVVDNCSPDVDVEALVKEVGKGRVSFYRRPFNAGQVGNWNTCINRARGHWIHILHDDDIVLPGFYSRLRSSLEKEPSVGAALCRYIYMDEEGHWQYLSELEMRTPGILSDWLERLGPGVIQCPAVVVKRSTYEKLGGFSLQLEYMFDMEMWMRIAVHYPFWYEPKPLACYRSLTSISGTSALFKSDVPVTSSYRLLVILQSYIPEKIAAKLIQIHTEKLRIFSIVVIRHNISQGNFTISLNQIKTLLKCDPSFRIIKGIVGSFIWGVKKSFTN
ncbi:MAG TPA: glycosyltransferase [Leptolyngbyaceae cyanobacterium]